MEGKSNIKALVTPPRPELSLSYMFARKNFDNLATWCGRKNLKTLSALDDLIRCGNSLCHQKRLTLISSEDSPSIIEDNSNNFTINHDNNCSIRREDGICVPECLIFIALNIFCVTYLRGRWIGKAGVVII